MIGGTVLERFWQERQPRERMVIGIGCGLLLLGVGYAYLWQPLAQERQRLREVLPRLQAQAAQLAAAREEVIALRGQLGAHPAADLRPALDQSVAAFGLRLGRLEVEGDARATIALDGVAFDSLVRWLKELQTKQRLRVESCTVEPVGEPGRVRVRAVLTSQAPVRPTTALKTTALADSIEPILGARLFGGMGAAVSGQTEPLTALNLKLKGVYASPDRVRAVAVINTGEKDDAFRIGSEVLPDVTLEVVRADHVLLRRQGMIERLNMEQKAATPGYLAQAEPKANNRSAAEKTLARSELSRALRRVRRPEDIASLTTNPAGQNMLETVPRGSLAEKLGLQPGDVVLRINGHPVRSQDDLPQIFQQLGGADQVAVDSLRDGKTMRMEYKLQ